MTRVRRSIRNRSKRRDGRRLISMVCMLILLGMMISHASKPSSWQWLVNDANLNSDELVSADGTLLEQPAALAQADLPPNGVAAPAPPAEIEAPLIPGPTDQDPEEWEAAQHQFRDIRDKHPFSVEEMPSYWRLFRWIHAQSRLEMSKRSIKNPFFTQVWEQPAKNRGKLYSMKLEVRRVLSHEPEENSAGVKRVYELWGVTSESRAHLYCVLVDELPEGFPQGAKVEAAAYFTGYFLKIMGYEASDAQRGAPVLIGKIKNSPLKQMPKRDPVAARNEFFQTIWIGVGVLCLLPFLRFVPASWYRKSEPAFKVDALKATEDEAESWLASPPGPDSAQSSLPVKRPPLDTEA